MVEFTDEEKLTLVKELSQLYYQRNFGSTSKTDLDTLMFFFYLDHCRRAGMPCDDYTLSKALGITQSRVRSLKERTQLKYPQEEFAWMEEFAKAIASAKQVDEDRYVKVIIQDVNVMTEVRHLIEQMGWYDECSLNRKLLRIPYACFVDICAESGGLSAVFSEEAKENIKKLKSDNSEINEFLKNFTKEGLKHFLMTAPSLLIGQVLPMLELSGASKAIFEALQCVITG